VLAQKTEYLLWTRFDVNLFDKRFVIGQLVASGCKAFLAQLPPNDLSILVSLRHMEKP
jgi:hypothetical protein